jgi:cell division protein FtsI (penicillin-binding protein 3)
VLREQMASPEAIKMIQHCLYEVVHTGLGRKAGSKMFDVSGKTGTAQIWTKAGKSQEYLISFAGYFPSQNPKYACIVCIRKSGVASGGGMCGPVFKRVAESIMAKTVQSDFSIAKDTVNSHLPIVKAGDLAATRNVLHHVGVSHQADFNETTGHAVWGSTEQHSSTMMLKQSITAVTEVPNVKGYGLRDAIYRLEEIGLKVKFKGVGNVHSQSLKPGSPFKVGDVIELQLKE